MLVRFSCSDDLAWRPEIEDWSACDSEGSEVNLQNPSKGGLDEEPLQYRVCPFDTCLELWPAVCSLRWQPSLIAAVRLCGLAIPVPMPGSLRAVNINTLRPGQGYQKHVDGNAVTVLIFLTTCLGGELDVFQKSGIVTLDHRAGQGVVFAGGQLPHQVRKVQRGVSRMLLFSYGDSSSSIDLELESQLYGRTSEVSHGKLVQALR